MKDGIIFDRAAKSDISELIRLRIAYMVADFGYVTGEQRAAMEKQLPDYFERKLNKELIAFVARDGDRLVGTALLHLIEIPANSILPNGWFGEVLGVYTEDAYRGQGICTQLIKNLLDCGKQLGLGRIDLSATKDGYPIYHKLGFREPESRYTVMRYTYDFSCTTDANVGK